MKIKHGLIKMTLNYLGQLIVLTFQVKIFTKCNYYPPEFFNLTRFNGIFTTDRLYKQNNCSPKFLEEPGE